MSIWDKLFPTDLGQSAEEGNLFRQRILQKASPRPPDWKSFVDKEPVLWEFFCCTCLDFVKQDSRYKTHSRCGGELVSREILEKETKPR